MSKMTKINNYAVYVEGEEGLIKVADLMVDEDSDWVHPGIYLNYNFGNEFYIFAKTLAEAEELYEEAFEEGKIN